MNVDLNQVLSNPILSVLGGIVIFKFFFSLINLFYARIIRSGKNLKKLYGEWAIVTGATDGIGKGMAMELARKGHNIIVIARNEQRLAETAKEITEKYSKVQVKTLAIDYDNFDQAAQSKVADAVKDLDVGVLVNNVGISYPYTKYFHELEDERVRQLIALNVDSTTWMTRIVLPGMVDRKRGAIVNVGSAAGVTTSPLLAQYSAAKSYITMFSRGLNSELAKFNIHVQCQVPLFVTTKLAKIKKASLFVPNPTTYARSAIAAIGYETVVSPFWTHALQMWIMDCMPEWLVARITMNMHIDIRKRGMKKDAEAAKDKKA